MTPTLPHPGEPSQWRTLLSPTPIVSHPLPSPTPPTCICDRIPLGGLPGHLGQTAAVREAADPREVMVEGDAAKGQVCSGHKKTECPLPALPSSATPSSACLSPASPPVLGGAAWPAAPRVLPCGPAAAWVRERVPCRSCGEESTLVGWLWSMRAGGTAGASGAGEGLITVGEQG